MSTPLNPTLHKRLIDHFGSVRISSEGEQMVVRGVREADGDNKLNIEHDGEYYAVNCPFCNDTRHRLYISYMFGKRDADSGRRMSFLAHCFNEDCLQDYENKRHLLDILDNLAAHPLEDASVRDGEIIPDEAREVQPPGVCHLLSELPDTHEARTYIIERGFDPDMLSERYGVSYCTSSRYFLAKDRLIIPVVDGGKLKGWQARYIGELPWKHPDKEKRAGLPPKYFSCPRSRFRSMCIYNWANMKQWSTGVIVEGPTDVWRFGAMSGCVFGNTVTSQQERKLRAIFRPRSLVMLLDPEEFASKRSMMFVEKFKTFMGDRFCAVKLPDGTDPGALDREYLRGYVKEEAARQGVRVSYRKWRLPCR